MRTSLRKLVSTSAEALPERTVRSLLSRALGDHCVALCLHRVAFGARRPEEREPGLTIPADRLDRLLGALLSLRSTAEPWLTVCFDDGYDDAREYVATRAPKLRQIEWLLFVCPEKLERRSGFRWDALERGGGGASERGRMEPHLENLRPELARLADEPAYRLSTVEQLRELASEPNVELGNHTNVHQLQTLYSRQEAAAEYARSRAAFVRLFGRGHHFAFPFGTPLREFRAEHVHAYREVDPDGVVWSTEQRPFAAGERRPGAVLPRFPIDGTLTVKQSLAVMAVQTARFRTLGPRAHFPDDPGELLGVSASIAEGGS